MLKSLGKSTTIARLNKPKGVILSVYFCLTVLCPLIREIRVYDFMEYISDTIQYNMCKHGPPLANHVS